MSNFPLEDFYLGQFDDPWDILPMLALNISLTSMRDLYRLCKLMAAKMKNICSSNNDNVLRGNRLHTLQILEQD